MKFLFVFFLLFSTLSHSRSLELERIRSIYLEAENSYLTFISRIRKDSSNSKAINMWVVSDNLLKGAALNTVQIAEQLIKKNV